MKKIAIWRCSTKISKTDPKTMISPLLTGPQGCQGCQKIQKTKLKTNLVSWIAKIQPKLNKIKKSSENSFFYNFCSILTVFHTFFNFGLNLSTPTHLSGLQFGHLDFMIGGRQQWSETIFGHLDHCGQPTRNTSLFYYHIFT